MKNTIKIIFAITLILTSCAPSPTPLPTVTPAPPTKTPLPPTEIPATTTPDMIEVEQGVEWPIIMDFAQCLENKVSEEDLKPGGKLDQFLAQIKPEIMKEIKWDIIKDDIRFTTVGGFLVYFSGDKSDDGGGTGVKFVNPDLDPNVPDTNPFDKNIGVCGKVKMANGNSYIVTVYEIRDINAPTESGHDIYFLKLLMPLQHSDGTPYSQFEIDFAIETWKKEMNYAPIGLNSNPLRESSGFQDTTFAHLDEGTPEFEIWRPALHEIHSGRPVHGPLSEFKKLEPYLWPTTSFKQDGNRYK